MPTSDVARVGSLERVGFRTVDVSVTFRRDPGLPLPAHPARTRDARPDDRHAVMAIAEREYDVSRFHLDPGIPDEVARSIKREWADNYFTGARGDRMFVAEHDDEVAGFQLVLDTPEAAVIDLIAVAGTARGQGIGSSLVRPGTVKPRPSGAGGDPGRQSPGVADVRASRVLRGADGLRSSPARLMRIEPVDTDRQVAVIAEIGNNHEGDIATARELVGAAAAGPALTRSSSRRSSRPSSSEPTTRAPGAAAASSSPPSSSPSWPSLRTPWGSAFSHAIPLGAVGWLQPLVDALKVASGDNDYARCWSGSAPPAVR